MQRFFYSEEYLREISKRIRQYRISAELMQEELAEKAGVSLRTLQYFENGHDIRFENFIKILMALGLADNLEVVVPDVNNSPIRLLEIKKSGEKSRVRKKKKANDRTFKWGDEM